MFSILRAATRAVSTRTACAASPLEQAADTRRSGLIFLATALPVVAVWGVFVIVTGDASAADSFGTSMAAFSIMGATLFASGDRDVKRLAGE